MSDYFTPIAVKPALQQATNFFVFPRFSAEPPTRIAVQKISHMCRDDIAAIIAFAFICDAHAS
jgi:hypothetical protein